MNQRFARLSEITSKKDKPGRFPISPATWWRWVAEGKAPRPVNLGPNTTAWAIDELDKWEAQKLAEGQPA